MDILGFIAGVGIMVLLITLSAMLACLVWEIMGRPFENCPLEGSDPLPKVTPVLDITPPVLNLLASMRTEPEWFCIDRRIPDTVGALLDGTAQYEITDNRSGATLKVSRSKIVYRYGVIYRPSLKNSDFWLTSDEIMALYNQAEKIQADRKAALEADARRVFAEKLKEGEK